MWWVLSATNLKLNWPTQTAKLRSPVPSLHNSRQMCNKQGTRRCDRSYQRAKLFSRFHMNDSQTMQHKDIFVKDAKKVLFWLLNRRNHGKHSCNETWATIKLSGYTIHITKTCINRFQFSLIIALKKNPRKIEKSVAAYELKIVMNLWNKFFLVMIKWFF